MQRSQNTAPVAVAIIGLMLISLAAFGQQGRQAAFKGKGERPREVPENWFEVYIGWFDSTNAFHITDSISDVDTLTGWMENVRSDGNYLFWNSLERSYNHKKIILGYGYIPIEQGKLQTAQRVAYTLQRRLDPQARTMIEFGDEEVEIATRFWVYHFTTLRLPAAVLTKKSLHQIMRLLVRIAKGYPKSIQADFAKHLLDRI